MPKPEHMILVSRYFVTDGSKFGADYLLYPGDPLLYHAQFTVQVLDHQAAIKPALLIGGARGSHSARKHRLLASVGCTLMLLLLHIQLGRHISMCWLDILEPISLSSAVTASWLLIQ